MIAFQAIARFLEAAVFRVDLYFCLDVARDIAVNVYAAERMTRSSTAVPDNQSLILAFSTFGNL